MGLVAAEANCGGKLDASSETASALEGNLRAARAEADRCLADALRSYEQRPRGAGSDRGGSSAPIAGAPKVCRAPVGSGPEFVAVT